MRTSQGSLPSFERGIFLADPSVFSPDTTAAPSLHYKAVFARNFLPVTLPAAVLQLLQVTTHTPDYLAPVDMLLRFINVLSEQPACGKCG